MAVTQARTRSDAELVLAAKDGDKDAFGALIDRHQPMVVALVQRLLANPVTAADAAQEAAVMALVGLSRLRSAERFGAWYAGIALNIARRWLRALRATTPLAHEQQDDTPGPDELAEAKELAKRVRGAVQGLPRGQRQAVLAFYWQGLSHIEAAAELSISPGAVKARLHQARASLAPELAAYTQQEKEVLSMPGTEHGIWVEVDISEVGRTDADDPSGRLHAVVLTERGGERRLSIAIGAPEAVALACSLESVETPRPMTYQFAADLAKAGGSDVSEVKVTRLSAYTFYAVVVLIGPAGPREVDARPSDALNLALVCNAPVRVHNDLLDHTTLARPDAWVSYTPAAREMVEEVRDKEARMREKMATARQQNKDG